MSALDFLPQKYQWVANSRTNYSDYLDHLKEEENIINKLEFNWPKIPEQKTYFERGTEKVFPTTKLKVETPGSKLKLDDSYFQEIGGRPSKEQTEQKEQTTTKTKPKYDNIKKVGGWGNTLVDMYAHIANAAPVVADMIYGDGNLAEAMINSMPARALNLSQQLYNERAKIAEQNRKLKDDPFELNTRTNTTLDDYTDQQWLDYFKQNKVKGPTDLVSLFQKANYNPDNTKLDQILQLIPKSKDGAKLYYKKKRGTN